MSEAARFPVFPTITRRAAVALSAVASMGAAGIHAWVVPEHLREYWLFGAFFIAVSIGQLIWAAAVTRWPNRASFLVGAAGSALLIALWLVSRTFGLPLGPEHWEPEPTGVLDGTCVLLELALTAMAVLALRDRRDSSPAGSSPW